jgi:hypothetical protein
MRDDFGSHRINFQISSQFANVNGNPQAKPKFEYSSFVLEIFLFRLPCGRGIESTWDSNWELRLQEKYGENIIEDRKLNDTNKYNCFFN